MRTCLIPVIILGLATVLGACEESSPTSDQGFGEQSSALRVATAIDEDSDVAGVRFSITACGEPGAGTVLDRPLEDQILPGNIPELQNNPLDTYSEHLFADLFQVVDPGCYDVDVQPITSSGKASAVCASAWQHGVMVEPAETTEILLLIQCMGTDKGAIDIIAALNHEPSLDDVGFDDSKFFCAEPGRVCMEGSDVDGDPLELELIAEDGCTVTRLVATGDPPSESRACFQVACDGFGRFDLRARVYDLAWKEGALIRIEDWLTLAGYPNESHGELNFWAYFNGYLYYPDNDGDGYGDAVAEPLVICAPRPPQGYTTDHSDCDDGDPTVHPAAAEVCDDAIDNNCDGYIDDCDCVGQVCGGFQNGQCDCADTGLGYCWSSSEPEVSGVCGRDFFCGNLSGCNRDAECAYEEHCLVQTCCGGADGKAGICAPAAIFEPQCTEFPQAAPQAMGSPASTTAAGN